MSESENNNLIAALSENLKHARHQEISRERQNYIYWTLWIAVLGFMYHDASEEKLSIFVVLPRYWLLLLALLLMSIAVFITSLKWSAELMNHMAAVASIAAKLQLNNPTGSKSFPLPYPEFRGYMALPLKLRFIFNVAPWMCGIQAFGIGGATFLSMYGFITNIFGSIGICLIILISLISFGVAFSAVWIAWKMSSEAFEAVDSRSIEEASQIVE